ncbi:hypothetical protein BMS3Abin16_00119 [archaeon BMS3Abin16]|nr:hypothetical protein BMS3Abin16_00119 [archaeon BMS3Abin16]
MLKDKEKRFLKKCIECDKPEMDIIDADMVTLSCPTREMNICWEKEDF